MLEEDPATYPASFENFLKHVHRRIAAAWSNAEDTYPRPYSVSEARLLLPRSGNPKIVQLSVEVRDDDEGNRSPWSNHSRYHRAPCPRDQAARERSALRSTVELAAVGIAHVDPDGHVIWSNSWLRNMLGYTQEELSQLTVWHISHPEDVHATDVDRKRLHAGELDSLRSKSATSARMERPSGSRLPLRRASMARANCCMTSQLSRTSRRASLLRHAFNTWPRTMNSPGCRIG